MKEGTGFYKYCGVCFTIYKRAHIIIHNWLPPGQVIIHGECLKRG